MTQIIAIMLAGTAAAALICIAGLVSWITLSEFEKRHPYWNAIYISAAVWMATNGFAALIIYQLGAALK